MWHVTRDMWHVTCDTWDVTHDLFFWGVVNVLSKFQLPTATALTVCDLWNYEDLEEKADLMNESINQWITRLFIKQRRLHRVC